MKVKVLDSGVVLDGMPRWAPWTVTFWANGAFYKSTHIIGGLVTYSKTVPEWQTKCDLCDNIGIHLVAGTHPLCNDHLAEFNVWQATRGQS